MRNKYILYTEGYTEEGQRVERMVREVVADAVVNNEGFLTFVNLAPEPEVGLPPKPATLVEIVGPDFWTRLENTGAYIAPSNTGVAPEGDNNG